MCLLPRINKVCIPTPLLPMRAKLVLAWRMEEKGKGCHCRVEQLLSPIPYPHTCPKGQQGSEFTYPGRGGRQLPQQKSPREGEKLSSLLGSVVALGEWSAS